MPVRGGNAGPAIRALQAFLSGRTPDPATHVDPEMLYHVARVNKLLLILPGDPALLPPGCENLGPQLDMVRLRVTALNRRGLLIAADLGARLGTAGIDHIQLKGPLQQVRLYGDPVRKPSGDVDILVRPGDRLRAGRVLHDIGYVPTEAALAGWWTHFLGERHFTRPDTPVTVDLHHGLQQAGLPRPHQLGGFLDRAVTIEVEGASYQVPSLEDTCLIAAITLVKALIGQEPSGSAAMDLAAAMRLIGTDRTGRLAGLARETGLQQTLALGLALTDAALETRLAIAASPLPELTSQELSDMVFQPWLPGLALPRRRRLLRALCGPDLLRLGTEFGRSALSIGYLHLLTTKLRPARPTEKGPA